ncbi:hypothetical protein BO94DRAFT_601737 [Aspergillus sclerotioniger CBS 115572]|uniref:Uncharacterized protein n=1 Tax=Aspergillus sclerotioniger CBS 115572 TaxID=1450535 RepID=A0A317W5V1_9EURO|nr:hypothetical protein BO94DRAFT_601737 [Aspergillus sclerotioniger CBS 115572]PWY81713.1 hypothetical protein BO94DRAFT_601737 [Aspergillus sclerotioniger CBS 115572]
MLFGKTLITLLVSATITAIAAPVDTTTTITNPFNALADRTSKSHTTTSNTGTSSNPFANIKASTSTWERAAKLCKEGYSKRDLDLHVRTNSWPPETPSGFNKVDMGEIKGALAPKGLWTYGLVTCIGLGVTGTQKDATKDARILMHLPSTKKSLEERWGDLLKLVEEAGMTDMEGWMSIPDTENQVPSGWSADLKELTEEVAEAAEWGLKQVIGKTPKVVKRPMALAIAHTLPHGTMQIDKENKVEIDGVEYTQ